MHMKKTILAFVLVCVAFLGVAGAAHAQEDELDKNGALVLFNIQHKGLYSRQDAMEKTIEPPLEPYFKQVQFLKPEPPKTLTERVDRLIYGIKTDVPPEYDHYGYEIRRYMKSILTPADLINTLVLPEKIQNAKTARIILDYWKKSLLQEMQVIEKEIEATNATSTLRINYKYNAGIVNSFIPDAYLWIDRNIEFLEYLQNITGSFYISYPFYDVPDYTRREKVQKLYDAREKALESMIAYSPFRAMVY